MRRFVLDRIKDVSGVSGLGIIADGVVFPDGVVVLHWRGRWHSTEILRSVQDCINIHGHEGATRVVWMDSENNAKPKDFGEQ